MMTFKCETCNLTFRSKYNCLRHVQSEKHKNNAVTIEKKLNENNNHTYVCTFCQNVFTNHSNLSRHKKACQERKQLKDEIDKLTLLSNQKDETISVLKSEVSHLKRVVNNSGAIIKTSVSALSFVMSNYGEAPILESSEHLSQLCYTPDDAKSNKEFVENLVSKYTDKILASYLGDFIIKAYKKDDPSQQSLWNSDTSRLTYLIRNIINNNADWEIDKKGIKINELIIKPFLSDIQNCLQYYVQKNKLSRDWTLFDAKIHADRIKHITEIIHDIEIESLNSEVLKYITPFFFLKKDEEEIN